MQFLSELFNLKFSLPHGQSSKVLHLEVYVVQIEYPTVQHDDYWNGRFAMQFLSELFNLKFSLPNGQLSKVCIWRCMYFKLNIPQCNMMTTGMGDLLCSFSVSYSI